MLVRILSVLIRLLIIPTFLFPPKAEFSVSLPHIIQLSKKLFFAPIRPLLFSSLLPKLSLFILGLLLSKQVLDLVIPSKVSKILPSLSTLFPSKPVWLLARLVS